MENKILKKLEWLTISPEGIQLQIDKYSKALIPNNPTELNKSLQFFDNLLSKRKLFVKLIPIDCIISLPKELLQYPDTRNIFLSCLAKISNLGKEECHSIVLYCWRENFELFMLCEDLNLVDSCLLGIGGIIKYNFYPSHSYSQLIINLMNIYNRVNMQGIKRYIWLLYHIINDCESIRFEEVRDFIGIIINVLGDYNNNDALYYALNCIYVIFKKFRFLEISSTPSISRFILCQDYDISLASVKIFKEIIDGNFLEINLLFSSGVFSNLAALLPLAKNQNLKNKIEHILSYFLQNASIDEFLKSVSYLDPLIQIANISDTNLGLRSLQILCYITYNYEWLIPLLIKHNIIDTFMIRFRFEVYEVLEDILKALLKIMTYLKLSESDFFTEFHRLQKIGFISYNEYLMKCPNLHVSILAKDLDKILWYSH
ncbi:unnamed protein product [Blepharisma stoltei]|uniref:Uncharacterized protein n=1 Tax=Blepharisma stoltei TaxID=1481888 RepID=A0AAU9J3G7_9CILI|nr:unnamed protein product [Blepharisma stoltei]